MSSTYTDREDTHATEAYVPVYARKRRTGSGAGRGGVKAWMVLAPLGVLTVGGLAAMMMISQRVEEAEPAVAAPVASTPAPLPAAPVAQASPLATPAPVSAAPVARSAPVERRGPVARRAPARRAAPAVASPAGPAADDSGDAATADLNRAQASRAVAAPTVTPAPATPAPVTSTEPVPASTIQVQPSTGQ